MKVISCIVTLTLFAGTALAGPDLQREVRFEIPAQPLENALLEFSRQAQVPVLINAKAASVRALSEIGAPSVNGLFVARTALVNLLDDSGYSYSTVGNAVAVAPMRTSDGGAVSSDAGRLRLAQAASSDAAVASNSSGSDAQLEEVVVTATKRAENVQDVPLSIAVVGADEIERRGLVGAEDYLRGMPGVNQTDSNVGASVIIRGLETTSSFQGFASGNTVATYFGETSTTSSSGVIAGAAADIKLVDVERVEVLRGPQGTAFGSSSLGGVVRIIPRAPKLDGFEGKVSVGTSFTSDFGGNNQAFDAAVSVPLVQDKLAVRVVGYRFKDSGFYRNVAATDATLLTSATNFGAQAFALNDDEVGEATYTGGRASALFQATSNLKLTVSFLKQKTEVEGWAGDNRGGYTQAILQVGPSSVIRGMTHGGQDYDIELANALLEYDLGWGDLTATYSHLTGESAQAFPFSARPLGVTQLPMVTSSYSNHSENSGEIRVATKLDGPLNVLAGVYVENLNDYWEQPVYWYGDTTKSTFPSKSFLVNRTQEWPDLKQKAAFGEVSWKFLENFELTGGIRRYDYERAVQNNQVGDLTSGGSSSILRNTDASGNTYRANLSYKPTSDMLLYAGWAQGFRLGKPQPGLPSGQCDANGDGLVDGTSIPIASTTSIQSDSVDSYEIGAKFQLSNRLTVSGDVFSAKWDDIPVQIQQPCGIITLGYTASAGRARSDGVEVQAAFQATDALRIDAGASYIHARLTEAVPAQGFFAGDRLPSPQRNANLSLEYALAIGERRAFLRADSIYVGSFFSTVGNRTLRNEAGDYVKVDASVRVPIDRLSVDLFVHNVTNADEKTYVLNNNTALLLRPRTYGFRIGYEF